VRRIFYGQSYGGTVYISANPPLKVLAHDSIELGETDYNRDFGTMGALLADVGSNGNGLQQRLRDCTL